MKDHIKSQKHRKAKAKYLDTGEKPPQQAMVQEMYTAKQTRDAFIKDFGDYYYKTQDYLWNKLCY